MIDTLDNMMAHERKNHTGRKPPHALVVALPLVLLLTACKSVPLPPWAPTFPRPAVIVVPQIPAPAPAAQPPAAVRISPLPLPAIAESVPQDSVAPYGAAVAARFPAPAVVYRTPGLQPGRTSFTTQDEIHGWLREQAELLARSVGTRAALLSIGISQQGEALEALVLTRGAGTDPAALEATQRPTVLLVAQQQGDEPAGGEALLVIARELAQGSLQSLLERVNVLIVPLANPDGVARGQRFTADGRDMGRDHLLLGTPETRALASLIRAYRPTVFVDAHEYAVPGAYLSKFGAQPRFDALLQYSATANLPEFLTRADEEWFRRPLLATLKGQGLTSEWYHTTSNDAADKQLSMGGTLADTLRNVGGLKNAVSLLVATRGAGIGRMHIQRRVHTHVTAIASMLGSTAQRASELGQLRPYLDKDVSAQACKGQAVVEAAPTPAQYDLVMLDPSSGADKIVTVDWDSTLELRTVRSRARPCGYWLSASSGVAVERLRLHGVQVRRMTESSALLADIYQAPPASTGIQSIVQRGVALMRGVIDAPAGSFYVPLDQPLGNLIVAALEPDTPASYFANQLLESLSGVGRVMAVPSLKTDDLQ